jgi:hypothetical protein
MMHKLTVIGTNILMFSGRIIYDEIIECIYNIDDLQDFLIIDYAEN